VVLQTFSLLSAYLDSFGEKHKKTLQASVEENCVSYLNKIKKQYYVLLVTSEYLLYYIIYFFHNLLTIVNTIYPIKKLNVSNNYIIHT